MQNDDAENTRGKPYPDFEPPNIEIPKDLDPLTGKPYTGKTIPSSNGFIGLIDAPDVSRRERGKNDAGKTVDLPSFLEQQWRKGRPDALNQDQKPNGGIDTVIITFEFNSYLVCIDKPPGPCIAKVDWVYSIRGCVRYDWKPQVPKVFELGVSTPNRNWTPIILETTYDFKVILAPATKC